MSSTWPFSAEHLLHITDRARRVLDGAVANTPSVTLPQPEAPTDTRLLEIARTTIRSPSSITSELIARGFSARLADQFDAAYFRYADTLKQEFDRHIQVILRSLPRLPEPHHEIDPHPIREVYQSLYNASLKKWVAKSVQAYDKRVRELLAGELEESESRHGVNLVDIAHEKAKAFSPDVLQLLEHTFDKNPYPTRENKESLARAAGIEFKQVHVWFQNRRNRLKKSGGGISKQQHQFINASVSIPSLSDTIVHKSFSETVRRTPVSHIVCVSNPLNPPRPSHAFPLPYSPDRDVSQSSALYTPWPHRPAKRVEPGRTVDVDEEDLVLAFSRLKITDTALPRCSPEPERIPRSSRIYHCSSVVALSRAPHPSLLQVEAHRRTSPTSRYASRRRARLPTRTAQPRSRKSPPASTTKFVVGVSRDTAHPYGSKMERSDHRSTSSASATSSRSSRTVSGSSSDSTPPDTPPLASLDLPKFIFYKPASRDSYLLSSPEH